MHHAASKTGTGSVGAKKLAQHARKRRFWGVLSAQGELFRAHAHIRPRRANFFAHEVRQRGNVETNNTSARPQQGPLETGITSAPENCTKNDHFSPAKATAVSDKAQPARAKVLAVSGERATAHEHTRHHRCEGHRRDLPRCRWAVAGPGRASRRRAERSSRRGRLAGGPPPIGTQSSPALPVWRAPEGPEGTGGLRGAAPNEVRSPSLAGGRALRRPKHQRGHKQHHQ